MSLVRPAGRWCGGTEPTLATLTLATDTATVASGDWVAVVDVDDSNTAKKVTAQSIAGLAPTPDYTAAGTYEFPATPEEPGGAAVLLLEEPLGGEKISCTVTQLMNLADYTAAGSAEFSAATEKTALALDDVLLLEDAAASYAKKSVTVENLSTINLSSSAFAGYGQVRRDLAFTADGSGATNDIVWTETDFNYGGAVTVTDDSMYAFTVVEPGVYVLIFSQMAYTITTNNDVQWNIEMNDVVLESGTSSANNSRDDPMAAVMTMVKAEVGDTFHASVTYSSSGTKSAGSGTETYKARFGYIYLGKDMEYAQLVSAASTSVSSQVTLELARGQVNPPAVVNKQYVSAEESAMVILDSAAYLLFSKMYSTVSGSRASVGTITKNGVDFTENRNYGSSASTGIAHTNATLAEAVIGDRFALDAYNNGTGDVSSTGGLQTKFAAIPILAEYYQCSRQSAQSVTINVATDVDFTAVEFENGTKVTAATGTTPFTIVTAGVYLVLYTCVAVSTGNNSGYVAADIMVGNPPTAVRHGRTLAGVSFDDPSVVVAYMGEMATGDEVEVQMTVSATTVSTTAHDGCARLSIVYLGPAA